MLRELESALRGRPHVIVTETTRAGEETELGARAASEGAAVVIAVGGDGTWSKVAAGLLQSERRPPLALIEAGTGNDFAKSVGAPARDIRRTLALIDSGATKRVDAGTVEGRFFLVCCGFGFDTAVLKRMQTVRGLRGSARYLYSALLELSAYDGFDVSIAGDQRAGRAGCAGRAGRASEDTRRLLMLVIANARHYGGAFRIAPHASLSDGMLDAITVSPLATLRRAALLLSATRGGHLKSASVTAEQRPLFDLCFSAPPLYNLDGDLFQARSSALRVGCVPNALEIVAPAKLLRPPY